MAIEDVLGRPEDQEVRASVRGSPFFRLTPEILNRPEFRLPIQSSATNFRFPQFGQDPAVLLGQKPPPPPAPPKPPAPPAPEPAPAPAPAPAPTSTQNDPPQQTDRSGDSSSDAQDPPQQTVREPEPERGDDNDRGGEAESQGVGDEGGGFGGGGRDSRGNSTAGQGAGGDAGTGGPGGGPGSEGPGPGGGGAAGGVGGPGDAPGGGTALHLGGMVADPDQQMAGPEVKKVLLEGEYVMPPAAYELFGPILEAMRQVALEAAGQLPDSGMPTGGGQQPQPGGQQPIGQAGGGLESVTAGPAPGAAPGNMGGGPNGGEPRYRYTGGTVRRSRRPQRPGSFDAVRAG